jgi:hypothetical protein
MRKVLSAAQKKVLNRYLGTFYNIDDLPQDVQDTLDNMRWYETMWSDVNRYLRDKG